MKLDEVFVSAAQYARLRGVEATYINQLNRNARLVLDAQGRIAVHASDALIASTRLRQSRKGTAGAAPGHPWAAKYAARQRRAVAESLQQMIAGTLQDAAHALAPRVAGVTDVAQCRALLAQELGRVARKVTRTLLESHYPAGGAGNVSHDNTAEVPQEPGNE